MQRPADSGPFLCAVLLISTAGVTKSLRAQRIRLPTMGMDAGDRPTYADNRKSAHGSGALSLPTATNGGRDNHLHCIGAIFGGIICHVGTRCFQRLSRLYCASRCVVTDAHSGHTGDQEGRKGIVTPGETVLVVGAIAGGLSGVSALVNVFFGREGQRAQAANQINTIETSQRQNDDQRRSDLVNELDAARHRVIDERDKCFEDRRILSQALRKVLQFLEDDLIPLLPEDTEGLQLRAAVRAVVDRAWGAL